MPFLIAVWRPTGWSWNDLRKADRQPFHRNGADQPVS